MKRIISLLLVLITVCALMSAMALEEADIVGDWRFTKFISNGRTFTAEEYGNDGSCMTFNEGGTCHLMFRNENQISEYDGTWTIDGGVINAMLTGYNSNEALVISLNEDGSLSYIAGNTFYYNRGSKPIRITSFKITKTRWAYTGDYICPDVIVKAKVNGKTVTLERGKHFRVDYVDNDQAGKAIAIIIGTGDYYGFLSKTFTITKAKLSSVKLSKSSLKYTGQPLKPEVTVKAKVNGQTVTLTKGKDYTVTYTNNTDVGTAAVTVKGKGNFTGTITKTFKITPVKILKVSLSKYKLPCTGRPRKPIPTVTTKVDGQLVTLVKNTDYTVKYENNIEVGTATVTVTGKGNYTGTIVKTFTITEK